MKRVAITGLGVISAVGNTPETFFENLVKGKCGIDFITSFNTDELKVKIAAQVQDFNISDYIEKSVARRMDLYAQYAISAAAQAFADSGIENNINPQRFGVYVGSGIGGMNTFIEQANNLKQHGPRKISPHFIPMMISNIAAGNIAIRFGAEGPCLPVVTACSTGTNEIGEAFLAIRHGYADAIIAGGSEAAINPLSIAGFTNCMALTDRNDPADSSIPFDQRRDGFVIGEGAGIVVLEEYEHAKARGAKIYCEIAGYGNTCDAHHVTAPHPEATGAARAMELALAQAGYTPDMNIYINAHGTSTPLNDKTETLAIKNALGDKAYTANISSTKSMTGHALGAAGGLEAICAALALKNGVVPPTIGLKCSDPDCDLDYTPKRSKNAALDIALSNTFGFGGHNGVLAFKPFNI